MIPILYSMMFPIIVCVGSSIMTYVTYSKLVKQNKRKLKNGKVTKKSLINSNLIFGIIFIIGGMSMTLYQALDLFLKDYKTVEGVFTKESRAYRQLFAFEESFKVRDKTESYDHLGTIELKEGQKYVITYAHRTNMIMDIKEK